MFVMLRVTTDINSAMVLDLLSLSKFYGVCVRIQMQIIQKHVIYEITFQLGAANVAL